MVKKLTNANALTKHGANLSQDFVVFLEPPVDVSLKIIANQYDIITQGYKVLIFRKENT